jgi:hypothetical protein
MHFQELDVSQLPRNTKKNGLARGRPTGRWQLLAIAIPLRDRGGYRTYTARLGCGAW